jgi:hypothetical protein
MSYREKADEMLAQEMVTLLEHDAVKYPIPTGKEKADKKASKSKAVPPQLQVRISHYHFVCD